MSRPLESSEEYILAAFMSGELPVELRRRIIAYLNTNEQARDMLDMAQIAMDAAESGDGASLAAEPQARLTQSGGRRTWPEVEGDGKSQWKVTAFFAGAVVDKYVPSSLPWDVTRCTWILSMTANRHF